MLAHSNAPKAPDSISAIWFATGVKEVKKIQNLITNTNIIHTINIYILFSISCMWGGSAILHKQQGHLRLSHFIYFRTICLPYDSSVTWTPTRLSLQFNKQTNKQTWMRFQKQNGRWHGPYYLSIYLQQQHIYHHYLSSSSRFTYVLKKWHYGNKWRNWEALTKIYIFDGLEVVQIIL